MAWINVAGKEIHWKPEAGWFRFGWTCRSVNMIKIGPLRIIWPAR